MLTTSTSSLKDIWMETSRDGVALLSLPQMHCQGIIIHLQRQQEVEMVKIKEANTTKKKKIKENLSQRQLSMPADRFE